jgi:hypothetical protein
MTADDFRDIILALDGAAEGAHMGHPDFRANGRIFASLHSQDRFGMVKLTPEEQQVLLREHPESFEPSTGAWGRQGCTNVRLAEANRAAVRGAARLAWEGVMTLPPPRTRKEKAGPPKTGNATARNAKPRNAKPGNAKAGARQAPRKRSR